MAVAGTGGSGTGASDGVRLLGSGIITSSGGNVQVTGQGGGDNPNGDNGLDCGIDVLGTTAQISAGNNGTVIVNGTGGSVHRYRVISGNNIGVYVWGTITSSGGAVQVTGQGGAGNASANDGVDLRSGATITAGGSGKVSVSGTGGPGSSSQNCGIETNGTITSSGGDVQVNAQGGGLLNAATNVGIILWPGSMISAGGHGNVTLQGTGGATSQGANYGVYLIGNSSSALQPLPPMAAMCKSPAPAVRLPRPRATTTEFLVLLPERSRRAAAAR